MVDMSFFRTNEWEFSENSAVYNECTLFGEGVYK